MVHFINLLLVNFASSLKRYSQLDKPTTLLC